MLLMLNEMSACPCCTPMLETCPTGTPAMLTLSPLARPVTSVNCASMVWRLLNSEMLPILTASPPAGRGTPAANTMNLNADFGRCEQPHDEPPRSWVMMPPTVVGVDWSGCPTMP